MGYRKTFQPYVLSSFFSSKRCINLYTRFLSEKFKEKLLSCASEKKERGKKFPIYQSKNNLKLGFLNDNLERLLFYEEDRENFRHFDFNYVDYNYVLPIDFNSVILIFSKVKEAFTDLFCKFKRDERNKGGNFFKRPTINREAF